MGGCAGVRAKAKAAHGQAGRGGRPAPGVPIVTRNEWRGTPGAVCVRGVDCRCVCGAFSLNAWTGTKMPRNQLRK